MGKLALRLAFFAAGLNYTVLKLGEIFHRESPLLLTVALCVPAVVLGSASWWAVRSFARSWPVAVCALIVLLGLLHAGYRDNNRGIVFASYVAMTLPIAALIVEHRCWWLCARTYVYANALALGLAFWFEYQNHGIGMLSNLYRFGFLMSNDGTMRLANPNVVGGQLAFASVLAFVLYLRSGAGRSDRVETGDRPGRFSLGWSLFLSTGCILTASRGAFFALLGGMLLLTFWGTRSLRVGRVKDLVAVSAVLLSTTMFITVGTGVRPWESLQSRLDLNTEVLTGSGRVLIWKCAYDLWRSDTRRFLYGAGTGTAPDALGRYLGLTRPDGVTPGAVDAHNAFVEWGLSYGLIGLLLGLCLLWTVFKTALRMDRRDGSVNRRALLLCFCLASMNYVTFYQLFFVAAGGLMLSMLSEAPATAAAAGAAKATGTASVGQPPEIAQRASSGPRPGWPAAHA